MRRPVPFAAVAAASWAALAVQAAFRTPLDGLHLCPVRLLTGHECPGCGMGHAVVYAMRGDWTASLHSHPLGLPLFLAWTAWLAWGALNLARGRGFSDGFLPFLDRPALQWAALGLVLAVHAARTLGLVPV
ncbi:MAG: DUF2752 domain-containing protein [Elusimicrobia bacterium]|nr:DUF2752 domain-containing protein [Elusimicrobiota bacterium]